MTTPRNLALLFTCEHGGNDIPPPLAHLFPRARSVLSSHRGFDLGILPIATALARELHAPLITSTVSRLVCDLNRSLHSPTLFSEFTRGLSASGRNHLLDLYYHPFRRDVVAAIEHILHNGGIVIHLSIHSFTPVWKGKTRPTHIGLLYDPARPREVQFARTWRARLHPLAPRFTIHMNRPYRGTSDGLVTDLRTAYPPHRYLGLELELNQRLATSIPQRLTPPLIQSLQATLAQTPKTLDFLRASGKGFRYSPPLH